MEQVEEQLRRTPRALPQLHIADPAPRISSLSSGVEPVSIDDFTQSMFRLHGYDPEQPLRAAMAK
jgi:thymidylate synthase